VSGYVPLWAAIPVGFILMITAGLFGAWVGAAAGWDRCEEDQRWELEQARSRRARPVYRSRPQVPPGVAHQDWAGHVSQALAVARQPDLSASAWTARMSADMDDFLGRLFAEHPAGE